LKIRYFLHDWLLLFNSLSNFIIDFSYFRLRNEFWAKHDWLWLKFLRRILIFSLFERKQIGFENFEWSLYWLNSCDWRHCGLIETCVVETRFDVSRFGSDNNNFRGRLFFKLHNKCFFKFLWIIFFIMINYILLNYFNCLNFYYYKNFVIQFIQF